MKKKSQKILCTVLLAFFFVFLLKGKKWRTDSAPITKRFPLIENNCSVIWIGGTIGENQIFSGIGPSTYYIHCFICDGVKACPSLCGYTDFQPTTLPKLKTPRSLSFLKRQTVYSSVQFDQEMLRNKFTGKVYYFQESDILYIDVRFQPINVILESEENE